ncbi:MAG: MFS transporter [Micromonosporaceae bacterium]|nr:MFS transporter [Micromonosporaceae bacterium]
MKLQQYRRVLALPGVRPLILVALLARIPFTAVGVTLTLHVVLDLHRGYAAAGLVTAANTIGSALGAPLLGRLVDRRGLRPVLLLTALGAAAFWAVAPFLPYPWLMVAGLLGGLVALPVFAVVRQSIAALVGPDQRRPAYALDSMSVELSFMVGPALAVIAVTQLSARLAMLIVGATTIVAGLGLLVLNPPVRAPEEAQQPAGRVPRRSWLRGRLVALLVLSGAATVVLSGSDVSIVAVLRAAGQVSWAGIVFPIWCACSLVGGFVYGALRRPVPAVALVGLMGLLTLPVGLAGGWWALSLALLPAGILCAPLLAGTADEVSRLAPGQARGEAMGLQNSALTTGVAIGAPFAGAVIDASGPGWGFVAVGLVGVVAAAATLPAWRRTRSTGRAQPPGRQLVTAAAGQPPTR